MTRSPALSSPDIVLFYHTINVFVNLAWFENSISFYALFS
jgi:hypothetical protein